MHGMTAYAGTTTERADRRLALLDRVIKEAIRARNFELAARLKKERDALYASTYGRKLKPIKYGRTLKPIEEKKKFKVQPWMLPIVAPVTALYTGIYYLFRRPKPEVKRVVIEQRPRYDVPGWDARPTTAYPAFDVRSPFQSALTSQAAATVPVAAAPTSVTAAAIAQTPAVAPETATEEAPTETVEAAVESEGVMGYWNNLSTTTKVAVGVGALGAAYLLFLRK